MFRHKNMISYPSGIDRLLGCVNKEVLGGAQVRKPLMSFSCLYKCDGEIQKIIRKHKEKLKTMHAIIGTEKKHSGEILQALSDEGMGCQPLKEATKTHLVHLLSTTSRISTTQKMVQYEG